MAEPPSRPRADHPALSEALAALRARRPADAERFARDVLKAERSNAVAAEVLGRALLAQDRAAEAVETLRKFARRSDDPAIATLLSKALAVAGEGEQALEHLRTLVKHTPFAPALRELADQLERAGRSDEAVTVLESGIATMPDAIYLRMALGQLHLRRNERAPAREQFEAVRAIAPDRHDALTALARVLVLDGEHAVAADLYRRALGLRPDDALTRIALGKCLLDMGDRDGGEAMLRKASGKEGLAIAALAGNAHGRLFLKPSAAARFLRDTTED
jgi:tetratricopeptide (TPR) repeat protein